MDGGFVSTPHILTCWQMNHAVHRAEGYEIRLVTEEGLSVGTQPKCRATRYHQSCHGRVLNTSRAQSCFSNLS
jgi:hypothetical protein